MTWSSGTSVPDESKPLTEAENDRHRSSSRGTIHHLVDTVCSFNGRVVCRKSRVLKYWQDVDDTLAARIGTEKHGDRLRRFSSHSGLKSELFSMMH